MEHTWLDSWAPEAGHRKEGDGGVGHQGLPQAPPGSALHWLPLKTQPFKAGLSLPELQTRFLSGYLPQVEVLTWLVNAESLFASQGHICLATQHED